MKHNDINILLKNAEYLGSQARFPEVVADCPDVRYFSLNCGIMDETTSGFAEGLDSPARAFTTRTMNVGRAYSITHTQTS